MKQDALLYLLFLVGTGVVVAFLAKEGKLGAEAKAAVDRVFRTSGVEKIPVYENGTVEGPSVEVQSVDWVRG